MYRTYNELIHVQSTTSTTYFQRLNQLTEFLNYNQPSNHIPTPNTWGQCEYAQVLYIFQTFMLSHLTVLLINIGLSCTSKLTATHSILLFFLLFLGTRETETTQTLHQYTRAILTWGGRVWVGIFSLKLSRAVKVVSWCDTACYACRKELVDWTGSLQYCMYFRRRKSN